jgi:hypothetical protein
MTDPTSAGSHLDPDQLADLDEGLLTGTDEGVTRGHLATCERCRTDLAALTGVRETLAGASDVGPVPADVVARLDRGLAEVAAEPASTAVTRSITPLRAAQPAPRGLRWLQAAAVVVLLLAGGALGVSALRNAGGGDRATSATSSAGAADAPKAAAGAAFPLTASGRHWTKTSVTAAVPQLLAGTVGPTLPNTFSAQDEASGSATERQALAGVPAARLAGGPALADCVAELTGGPVTPLAVDLATFDGKPAAVVLLPGIGGKGRVDVWVVPPDCATGNGETFYYANVLRP